MGKIDKINRRIFGNSRFTLDFFMYAPFGSFTTRDQSSIHLNYNPILLLRYVPPRYVATEFDFNKASYKITPRNLYKVVKVFNTMMKWMYSEEFNDLFMVDENNNLIFNSDYSKLYTMVPVGDFDSCYLKAFPTVVDLGGKKMEGVNILINESTYVISMTHEEISMMFEFLKNFSFTQEVICALQVFGYIQTYQSYGENKRLEGKSPFD